MTTILVPATLSATDHGRAELQRNGRAGDRTAPVQARASFGNGEASFRDDERILLSAEIMLRGSA